jgi:hypothetical protein
VTHFHPKPGVLPTDRIADEAIVVGVQELLAWGQREGEFRPFSTRIMALALRRAIDGVLDDWSYHQDQDLDAHAEELVALFDHATRRGA